MALGEKTQLLSSKQSVTGDRCMTFWYHMFGNHIDTLNVYQDSDRIWSRSNNQANIWRKATITLKGKTTPYEVSISI